MGLFYTLMLGVSILQEMLKILIFMSFSTLNKTFQNAYIIWTFMPVENIKLCKKINNLYDKYCFFHACVDSSKRIKKWKKLRKCYDNLYLVFYNYMHVHISKRACELFYGRLQEKMHIMVLDKHLPFAPRYFCGEYSSFNYQWSLVSKSFL